MSIILKNTTTNNKEEDLEIRIENLESQLQEFKSMGYNGEYHHSNFTGQEIDERLSWAEILYQKFYNDNIKDNYFLTMIDGTPQWVEIITAEDMEI